MSGLGTNATACTEFNGESCNESCHLKPEAYHTTVLPWIYLWLAIVGFLTNGLALLELWRSEKTPTIIFTLNIMVSDLTLCFSLPFRTAYYMSSSKWKAGTMLCFSTEYIMTSCSYINIYCNMSFLLYISINRYATVVQRHWRLLRAFKNSHHCWFISLATWVLVVITVNGTLLYNMSLKSRVQLENCFDQVVNKITNQVEGMHSAGAVMFFIMLGLMLVSYGLLIFHLHKVSRGSLMGAGYEPGGGLKVRRKILAAVVLFVACFLPYHVQRLRMMMSGKEDCQEIQKDHCIKTLMILITALNCCLHPLLHLVLRSACCRATPNAGNNPKPENSKTHGSHTNH